MISQEGFLREVTLEQKPKWCEHLDSTRPEEQLLIAAAEGVKGTQRRRKSH